MEQSNRKAIQISKKLLEVVRCELNESKDLEEAKSRVDELRGLLDLASRVIPVTR